MEDASEALRLVLSLTRDSIPDSELRLLVQRWSVPTKVVVRVVESDAVGSLCSCKVGICLLPGVSLPLGERLSADILPALAGCSWGYWAEKWDRVEDGWSLEANSATTARWKNKSSASASSSVQGNERPRHERGRRADNRAAPSR